MITRFRTWLGYKLLGPSLDAQMISSYRKRIAYLEDMDSATRNKLLELATSVRFAIGDINSLAGPQDITRQETCRKIADRLNKAIHGIPLI